jgi:hypothetical protein
MSEKWIPLEGETDKKRVVCFSLLVLQGLFAKDSLADSSPSVLFL